MDESVHIDAQVIGTLSLRRYKEISEKKSGSVTLLVKERQVEILLRANQSFKYIRFKRLM